MQIGEGSKQGPKKISGWFAFLKPVIIVLTVVMMILIVLINIKPPEAVSKDAAPSQFSSERAMEHLSYIAKKPHAMGSQAHQEVQRYIINNLTDLEIEPEILKTIVIQDERYTFSEGKPLQAAKDTDFLVGEDKLEESLRIEKLILTNYVGHVTNICPT